MMNRLEPTFQNGTGRRKRIPKGIDETHLGNIHRCSAISSLRGFHSGHSISSTSSILEQRLQSVHHLQMTSSEGFQHHFSFLGYLLMSEIRFQDKICPNLHYYVTAKFKKLGEFIKKCSVSISVFNPFYLAPMFVLLNTILLRNSRT